ATDRHRVKSWPGGSICGWLGTTGRRVLWRGGGLWPAPIEIVKLPGRRRLAVDGPADLLTDDQQLCGHDPRDARKKIRRRPIVDGYDHDAVEETAPERDDPFGTVFRPEDDFIALDHSDLLQTRGKDARRARDLAVGIPAGSKSGIVEQESAASAGQ